MAFRTRFALTLGQPLIILLLCLFLLSACVPYSWPFNTRTHTYAAALGDLDGDGDLDAYLANGRNEGQEQDTVWWNDGLGNYSRPANQSFQAEKQHVSLGDLDGDGDLDALVDVTGADIIALNDGRGNFSYRKERYLNADNAGSYMFNPTLGDLDGDGDLDAVLAGCCGGNISTGAGDPGSPLYAFNMVWTNDGSGYFNDTGQRLGIYGTGMSALGDLDADGDLDIFDANSSSVVEGTQETKDRQPNIVWFNDGKGRFADSGQRLGREESSAIALGDLDGDGDLDAFVGNHGADSVWLNDGSGSFSDSGQALGNDDASTVKLGDLDGDGDLDALTAGRGFAAAWLNLGGAQGGKTGSFQASQRISISIWYAFDLGDVDSDGDLDLFAGLLDQDTRVWFNDGTGWLLEK